MDKNFLETVHEDKHIIVLNNINSYNHLKKITREKIHEFTRRYSIDYVMGKLIDRTATNYIGSLSTSQHLFYCNPIEIEMTCEQNTRLQTLITRHRMCIAKLNEWADGKFVINHER